MSTEFQLALDGASEDEYSNDEFEQTTPRLKDSSLLNDKPAAGLQTTNSPAKRQDEQMMRQQHAESRGNNMGPAAAVAVSPQNVTRANGVIGNMEYGLRSSTPKKSRGTPSQNNLSTSQKVKKAPSRANDDLEDVNTNRMLSKKKNSTQNAAKQILPIGSEQQRGASRGSRKNGLSAQDQTANGAHQSSQHRTLSKNDGQESKQIAVLGSVKKLDNSGMTPKQMRNIDSSQSNDNSAKTSLSLKPGSLPHVDNRSVLQNDKNSGSVSLVMPNKLTPIRVTNNDYLSGAPQQDQHSIMNSSLTQLNATDQTNSINPQQTSFQQSQTGKVMHHSSLPQTMKTTPNTIQQLPHQRQNQRSLQKQNFVNRAMSGEKRNFNRATADAVIDDGQSSHSALRLSKPGTLSTKNNNLQQTRGTPSYVTVPPHQEMPHIFVHQKQQVTTGGAGFMKPTMQQSAEGQPAMSKREKYQMIGRPYRVKTKLPFYDHRGVYQGVKIGQIRQGQLDTQKKLQQFEAAYSTSATQQQKNLSKKSRSISQVHSSFQNEQHQQQKMRVEASAKSPRDDATQYEANKIEITPRAAAKEHMQPRFGQNMTAQGGSLNGVQQWAGQHHGNTQAPEYQSIMQAAAAENQRVRSGLSNSSGNNRIGAVAAPSLGNLQKRGVNDAVDQTRQSFDGFPHQQQMRNSQKKGGLQTSYKVVHESPFIENVTAGFSNQNNQRSQTKNQRSTKQILATSSQVALNHASNVSLLSTVECGLHGEQISQLNLQVTQLQEQLKVKDRLVSKILETSASGEEDQSEYIDSQRKNGYRLRIDQHSQQQLDSNKSKLIQAKLKSELDFAYKILSQRDTEIAQMKKQVKQQAFNQCNEERILYMNECIKLQNLLKIYGAANLKKQFKGVKITQNFADSARRVDYRNRSRSPPSKDPRAGDQTQIDRALNSSKKKKPSTSNQKGKEESEGLTGTYTVPDRDAPDGALTSIEELQQKVSELEQLNEKLINERMELDREMAMQADDVSRLKIASRGLEQNLIEKVDLARSLQDLNDERKEEIDRLTKLYEREVSEKDQKLEALRLQLTGNDKQAVLLADMERLKKAHADALMSKEIELNKVREELLAAQNIQPSLNEQISQLKVEHGAALAEKDYKLSRVQNQLAKALEDAKNLTKLVSSSNSEKDAKQEQSTAQMADLQQKLQQAQKESTDAKAQLAQAMQQVSNFQVKLSETQNQIEAQAKLLTELQSVKGEKKQTDERITALTLEVESLKKQLSDLNTVKRELEERLERTLAEKQSMDESIEKDAKRNTLREEKRQEFMTKQAIAPLSDDQLQEQITDLEIQNAELETDVADLQQKVKQLTEELVAARGGRIVIENLDDKKNFANLISRQGTLVENLEMERRRAQELQTIVQKQEDETNQSVLMLLQGKDLKTNVATQTNPTDVPIAEEQDSEYADDFDQTASKTEIQNVSQNASEFKAFPAFSPDLLDKTKVKLNLGDTLDSVQQEMETARVNRDIKLMAQLATKECVLLGEEIEKLRATLIKKNELINVTLESQEQLTENQAKQQKLLAESNEKLHKSQLAVHEAEDKLVSAQTQAKQLQTDLEQMERKNAELSAQITKLAAEIKTEQSTSQSRLAGINSLVKAQLHEQFSILKITDEQHLQQLLEEQDSLPENILEDQFLIPRQVQNLIDTSTRALFNAVDQYGLTDVSQTELEIGFRRLKEVLDSRNMDFKVLLFDIDSENQDEEPEKEADEIRHEMSLESLSAKPLRKLEFIRRVKNILNDQIMAEKVALGCQKAAHSPGFVHFWAFNALWITINCGGGAGGKKLTMKQLLEQADREKSLMKQELERQRAEEKADLERQRKEEADRIRREAQEEADKVKKQMEDAQQSAKKREKELAEAARLREEELLKQQQLLQQPIDQAQEGEDGDREGFSLQTYRFIKKNNDLSVIVNIANASLYSIRNQCNVFNIDSRRLVDGHSHKQKKPAQQNFTLDDDDEQDLPFVSMTEERDAYGNLTFDNVGKDFEQEVIYRSDFYGRVLTDMGLKRYIDLPEETAKLDNMLNTIGALASDSQSLNQTKFIRLEVLISAMRIHKYEYSGLNLATKLQGVDLRTLNPKSMRIINRLTRVVAQYQDKYQQKAQDGVTVTIQQIVGAIFKGQIETQTISKPSGNSMFGQSLLSPRGDDAIVRMNTSGYSQNTAMGDNKVVRVQLISRDKFYQTLARLKIKKKTSDVGNLSRFLCMNDESPDKFLLKKLIMVIEEFLRNHYLKSFGYSKKRLDDIKQGQSAVSNSIDNQQNGEDAAAQEEYYYDEEEETPQPQPQPVAQNHIGPEQQVPIQTQHQQMLIQEATSPIAATHSSAVQNQAQNQQQVLQPTIEYGEEEEYYYDEEEDGGDAALNAQKQPVQSPNFKLQQQQQAHIPHSSLQQHTMPDYQMAQRRTSLPPDHIKDMQRSTEIQQQPGLMSTKDQLLLTLQKNKLRQQGTNSMRSLQLTGAKQSILSQYEKSIAAPQDSAGYRGEGEAESKFNLASNDQDDDGVGDDNYDDDNSWL